MLKSVTSFPRLLTSKRFSVCSVIQFSKVRHTDVVPDSGARRTRQQYVVPNTVLKVHRKTWMDTDHETVQRRSAKETFSSARDFRHVFPEFLPNPDISKRDRLAEKLQRKDMLRRRAVVDIPEFYVGSILAVTSADRHSPGRLSRFVGICIQRAEYCLRANFTLRNVVDGQGVEIRFDMYSPMIQKIEVLKLEKRLDDELLYLRDAPAEYSTFPFDMEPSPQPLTSSVPVNPLKVKLGPRPWHERWERMNLKGVEELDLPQRFFDRAAEPAIAKPWLQHDLMKEYRERINDVEVDRIAVDVQSEVAAADKTRHKQLRAKLAGTGSSYKRK